LLNQGDPDFEGGKHGCIFEAYDAPANNDNFSRQIGKFGQPVGVYDVFSSTGMEALCAGRVPQAIRT